MKVSALLLALTLGLVACAPQEATVSPSPAENAESPAADFPTTSDQATQQELLAVTTVAPITNIVSNVAGDRVKVVGIISLS